MNFKELLDTLEPVKDYEIEILLNSGESYIIENKPWKQWSLRILQNHLGDNIESKDKIDLKVFCEYYNEWLTDKSTHLTIWFLDRYNSEWWIIKKM